MPNMLDKTDKRVFASLNYSCIGGDILDYNEIVVGYCTINKMFTAEKDGYAIDMENLDRFKVVGTKGE